MTKLTENMVQQRLRSCMSDISNVVKINITGRELHDISLIRKLVNVEVLSLSVNRISTLIDLQYCKNLRELYLRKNNISNLNEICYLQHLPHLRALWLAENPCSSPPDSDYRLTVIRNLPHLDKLDDEIIKPEERQEAAKRGRELIHPDKRASFDENFEPFRNNSKTIRTPPISRAGETEPFVTAHTAKTESKTSTRVSSVSVCREMTYEPEVIRPKNQTENRNYQRVTRRPSDTPCDTFYSDMGIRNTSFCDKCHIQMKNPHNTNKETVKEVYANRQFDRAPRKENYPQKEGDSIQHHSRYYKPHDGFSARMDVDRHASRLLSRYSNMLSAVLCLIKELDFSSLEVVYTDIRCRLEDFEEPFQSHTHYCREQ